ncbi:MAG: PadR family transcriptional regulator [Chloroflexota bacterium]|jgi:DNA-binding PadR family transcriptional regulator|nr:PadR family transcriptional regulator [Chloroflexota bacterium]
MTDKPLREQTQNLVQELRRGVIVLAVLSQLHEEQYGYSLMKRLEEQGMQIDQGTLYPLLRRLEEQQLLESDWRMDTSRPRRYYILSDFGKGVLEEMSLEWLRIKTTVDQLLDKNMEKENETN